MSSEGPNAGEGVFCGVDVGAASTKVVLMDVDGKMLGSHVRKSGVDYQIAARDCLEKALAMAGLEPGAVNGTIATGYGRRNVEFAGDAKTEILCHSAGCYFYFPKAITIVDIGGQDNKIIRLDDDGRRVSFKMNRKCAAGTGAFLEEIAARLDLDLDELDAMAKSADKTVKLGSFCTVFSKTEILAHIRRGEPVNGIVRGAFRSVVERICEMETFEGDVVLTGGVAAHNTIVAQMMSKELGRDVHLPSFPQLTGALGAALLARDEYQEE